MRTLLLASLLSSTLACGSSAPAATTPEPAKAETSSPKSGGAPLTAEACQAAGGHVVGDIGDGAIHRPDYRCPASGAAPIGKIAPAPGGPIAIEGSVCCK